MESMMADTTTRRRHERIAARLTAEQKALIQRAADIEGRTLTDFVIASAEATARQTISTHEVMRLSLAGAYQLIELIENPPAPNEHLIAAARRYKEMVSH
jgi:uncharacterized protein (DUF1778 family)